MTESRIGNELLERIEKKQKNLRSLRPFNQGALLKLQESFRVSLTYNSNALEGNSLSLNETKLVLEEGITIGGKTLKEHLEATNHAKAMELIDGLVKKAHIDEIDVLELHALILDRIDPQNAGVYRKGSVRISGTDYTPPNAAKVPALMGDVYRRLNQKNRHAQDIIKSAASIHQRFVDIHPFIDGNGRTARLLLNLHLMRSEYPPVIILRTERQKYIHTIIEEQVGQNPAPFANFVASCVDRSLTIYLDALGTEAKEYLGLTEAAKISKNGYGAEYLGFLAREGKIGAVKFGRNWKISKEALEEYETEQAPKK